MILTFKQTSDRHTFVFKHSKVLDRYWCTFRMIMTKSGLSIQIADYFEVYLSYHSVMYIKMVHFRALQGI